MVVSASKSTVSKIPAGSTDLGTTAQDCAIIAAAFEKGAHATPSEAAVWAVLNRTLSNTKAFSAAAGTSLESYIKTPQIAAQQTSGQASNLSSAYSSGSSSGGGGTMKDIGELLQGVNFDNMKASIAGTGPAGAAFSQYLSDCIPCIFGLFPHPYPILSFSCSSRIF